MSKYWEIVQVSEDSFALQSSDEGEAPMVEIRFSQEARELLQGQLADVARVMIAAGIQSAGEAENEEPDLEADAEPVLH